MSRLRDIWSLNVSYRHLQEDFEKRRPIECPFRPTTSGSSPMSVSRRRRRHANDRRGLPAAWSRHSLQRFYRARWTGTVDAACRRPGRGGRSLIDGVCLTREPVMSKGEIRRAGSCARRLLRCPRRPVGRLPLYVNEACLTLERVEATVFRAGHPLGRVAGRTPPLSRRFIHVIRSPARE